MAICQMALRRWLVVPVVLTVVGSAFEVGAKPADISVGKLESTDNPVSADGEMRPPKVVSQFPNPIPPREPELPTPSIPPPPVRTNRAGAASACCA